MPPSDEVPDNLFDFLRQENHDKKEEDDLFSALDSLMGDESPEQSTSSKRSATHEFKNDLPDWMLNPVPESDVAKSDSIEDEDLEAFLGDSPSLPPQAVINEKKDDDYAISNEFSGWLDGNEIEDNASIDTLLSYLDEPVETIEIAAEESPADVKDLLGNLEDLELDLPDWLKDASLGESEGLPYSGRTKDDFAMLDDLLQQGKDSSRETIPLGGKNSAGEEEESRPLKGMVTSTETQEEMPEKDDMADLRFDALLSARKDNVDDAERVGALKDMTGVLKPEILFEGNSLTLDAMIEEFIVTPIQARGVEILKAAFAQDRRYKKETPRASTAILRLLTTVIMIGVILLPAIFNINILPEATLSPMFQTTYQFIEEIPRGSRILFIMDYGPDAAAELSPLTEVIMSHALDRNATIYSLSSNPLSTTIVEQLRQAHAIDSRVTVDRWLDFGYLPGGANGISSVIAGSMSTVLSPLYTDHVGQPTNLEAMSLAELDLAGIIVISSQFDSARLWIEQLTLFDEIPLFAVSSTAASPVLKNYAYSGQLTGMVAGVSDSAAYQTLRNGGPDDSTLIQWNAQALGGIAAAAIILASTVILSFTGRKKGKS